MEPYLIVAMLNGLILYEGNFFHQFVNVSIMDQTQHKDAIETTLSLYDPDLPIHMKDGMVLKKNNTDRIMTTVVSVLKATNSFSCDQVTQKFGTNPKWITDQIRNIDLQNFIVNDTAIGNLLFIYDYAHESEQDIIEKFLSGVISNFYKTNINEN